MPEFKYDYLLDADVFGHILFRPDSTIILDGIIKGIEAGRVRTVRQVASVELKKFREAYDKLHPYHSSFEIATELQYCDDVAELMDKIQELVPALYEAFGTKKDPADPWLIAVAKVHGLTLVTDEQPNSTIKIPMACDRPELRCRHISGPHFLWETGIVDELKPEHISVHSFYGLP